MLKLRSCIGSLFRRRGVRWGILALVAAFAAIGYTLHRERSIARHRKEAEAALDRLDLPAAVEHLRAVLALDSDSPQTHLLLAATLRRAGDFEAATAHLDDAKRLGGDSDKTRRERFLFDLQQKGIHQRSTNELILLVRERPLDRELLEALYRGDLESKNWDRAGLWLHLWLEQTPDDWPPRLWQAELLERFKKYDEARADYLRVLQLRPDYRRALLGAGMCALENRADYLEAEEFLRRFLKADPDHVDARVALARCRHGRGDLAGARELAAAVLASHPNHPGAALVLGTIEAEAGNDAEAIRWLSAAERSGADIVAVNYQLAQLFQRVGRAEEAYSARARFQARRDLLRDFEAATRAAERSPRDARSHYEVGRLCLILGEPEFAKQWFARALQQDPKHRPSHAALAECYSRESDAGAKARAEYHRRLAQ